MIRVELGLTRVEAELRGGSAFFSRLKDAARVGILSHGDTRTFLKSKAKTDPTPVENSATQA